MVENISPKDLIRQNAKKVRASLAVGSMAGEDLSSQFKQTFDAYLSKGLVVSAYWPLGKECDTLPLIDDLLANNMPVALPYIDEKNNALKFFLWDYEKPLVKSDFGAMHPDLDSGLYQDEVEPDIILLPLLAYDRKGNRLGYGAGHYDRYITSLHDKGKRPLLVGIAYMEQICLYPLPAEDHDMPLDCVLNPNGYTRFSPQAPEG